MKEELHIALVQTALVWENPEVNRGLISMKIDRISRDMDIIILPEMFTTGFTMSPDNIDISEGDKTIDWMQNIADGKGVAIVGSVAYNTGKEFVNRLFFVAPNEKVVYYDKRHTFTLAGEDKVYKAGTDKLIVDYLGFKICPLVCYDLRFPVWARNVDNYDVLLYVANWPKPRVAAWDALLKARAIENMSYCIGVNRIGEDEKGNEYSGHSAVYDCLGSQTVFSQKEEVLYATLYKNHISDTRKKLKFLEDRDNFTLVL